MGPSLQDMLTLSQTVEYFEIVYTDILIYSIISSTNLSFLTIGVVNRISK